MRSLVIACKIVISNMDLDMVMGTGSAQDPFSKRETLELVRAYYKITDPAVRRRLYQLVKSMSDGFEEVS